MIEYTFNDEDDSDETVSLPSKFVVCHRCQGTGVHDAWEGGMTGDEMAEQGPEFFEDYMDGVYNVKCTVCQGLRVIEVVDRERLTPELLRRYDSAEVQRREMEEYFAHAERMGY